MTVLGKDRRELIQEIRTLRTHLGRVERRNAERTKLDRELPESLEQFKAIFDDSPVGLYRTTPDGRILMANSALVNMLGYRSFDELSRRNLENEGYEPARPRSVFQERIEREGKVIGLESAWQKSDGTTLYIRESAHAVRDESGKTLYYQGTAEDITECKQAEEALRKAHDGLEIRVQERTAELQRANEALQAEIAERLKTENTLVASELHYRTTLDSMGDAIHVVDSQLRVVLLNEKFLRWGRKLGLDIGHPAGRTIFELFPFLPETVRDEYRQVFEEGRVLTTEEIIRIAGEEIATETRKIPIRQGDRVVRVVTVIRDITDRKRAERQICERARIIDSTTDSVIKTDTSGIVTLWNRGAEKIFGYTSAEMMGRPISVLYKEQDLSVLDEIVQTLSRGEEIATTEVTCVHKNGSPVELALSLLPLKDDSGNITDFVGISRDITERKKAQEALRESENRYRTVIENAGEGIIVVQDGKLRFVNSRHTLVTGRSPEESASRPFVEFVHPDDREKVAAIHAARLRGEQVTKAYEFRIIDKEGRTKWLENNGVVIEWGGRPASLNFLRDVTARKKTEDELRIRATILENMVEGVQITDEAGVIVLTNPSLDAMFGYERGELNGRHVSILNNLPQEENARFVESVIRQLQTRGTWSGEICNIKKDGTPFFSSGRISALDISGKKYWIFVQHDITDRKRVEKEKNKLLKAIETAKESISLTTPDGVIVYGNEAMDDLFGYEKGELIGQPVSVLTSGPGANGLVREALTALREKGHWEGEVVNKKKDGTEFITYATTSAIKDERGNIVSLIGTQHEITERKRAEEALKISEQRFRATIESLPFDFFMIGEDGRYVFQNSVVKENWGDIIGKRPEDIADSEEACAIWKENNRRAFSGETVQGEVSFSLKGEKRHYHNIVSPIHAKDGVRGILGMNIDITERRQAEKALRETTGLLETIFAHTHILVAYLDPQFNFVRVNRAYAQADGREPSFFVGRNHFDLYPHAENEAIFRKVVEIGVPYFAHAKPFEYAGHPERGVTYWDWSLVPIKQQDGVVSGLVLTLANVTEQKKAEQALREREATLTSLFRAAPVGIGLESGSLLSRVNDTICQMSGYSRDELIGRSAAMFYSSEEDYEAVCTETRRLILEKGKGTVETRWRHRDGQIIDVLLSTTVLDPADFLKGVTFTALDITERKRAEQAVKESEEKFRSLAEHSPNMIFINKRGRIVYANRKCEEIMGYPREEFYSPDFDFRRLVAPESAHVIGENLARHLRGQDVEPYDYCLINRKGERIEAINASKLIQYEGEAAILGVVTDITERKKAERSLRKSQERLKRAQSMALIGNWEWDLQKGTLHWEEENYRMFGIPRETIASMEGFLAAVHPDDLELVKRSVDAALNGEPCDLDFRIRRPEDGTERVIHANAEVTWDAEGKPTYFFGTVQDVTERKKAERALRESQERLEILFESAPDAIYVMDPEGRFVDGNRAAEEMVGFAKAELIGKSLAESGLLSAEDLPKAAANLREPAGREPSGPREYAIRRKDGSRIAVEIRTFPVTIGGRTLTLGIARNITARKDAEQKLLDDREQLKSLASQLSLTEERERHRLASELHDHIGQSLVISKIKLDRLRKGGPCSDLVGALNEVSACLGQVIKDTRSLTFDLSYPILYELGFEAAVAEWLTEHVQEKHGIETEFEDDGHPKPLDDDILALLFRNVRELLINVVKHAQARRVKVTTRRLKDQIHISVEDDGVGFDPVEVTAMAGRRAEFGLFSIRKRLEQLGGLFEVVSALGRGTRITMTAPLKYEANQTRTGVEDER